ncbi:hypothetical protein M569_12081 [Genlisea aurea]|uniref:Uncharacterized protein n=1 Tax=Genlisea aurea TaxID=192259 RepID=S8C7F1_9LAMI|nr:hypothetical protein M569_12081 [Genlisea aurea]
MSNKKVYGGYGCWRFIEEYSYKELIDSLLREDDDGEDVVHTDADTVKESPVQKRKEHCYGWIDDDEEYEAVLGDFVSLESMAEAQENRAVPLKRRRTSRGVPRKNYLW